MADEKTKVGIIACSGEEIPEGTISRLATRRVLELLRAGNTVTICLPLFLSGNEGEREFARTHPIITVDGCEKMCAKHATEKFSGTVSNALVVPDILDGKCIVCSKSTSNRTDKDKEAVWAVSERIAVEVDSILANSDNSCISGDSDDTESCACTKPLPGMKIDVDGQPVTIAGLSLIFDHLAETGLAPDESCGDRLLETVRIYHTIDPADEDAYKEALSAAYIKFRKV